MILQGLFLKEKFERFLEYICWNIWLECEHDLGIWDDIFQPCQSRQSVSFFLKRIITYYYTWINFLATANSISDVVLQSNSRNFKCEVIRRLVYSVIDNLISLRKICEMKG